VANENDVSVTLPATVEKVLPARDAEPEKIQISVDGCDELFSELRVENTLKNESGDSVTLKRGAHIEVTINADSKAVEKKEWLLPQGRRNFSSLPLPVVSRRSQTSARNLYCHG